jgi:hypothetical protein
MKKLLSITAIFLFCLGLFSCQSEDITEEQALYEFTATDGDTQPSDDRDSTDGDTQPSDDRDSTDGDTQPSDDRDSTDGDTQPSDDRDS